jgi:hypothetical protein
VDTKELETLINTRSWPQSVMLECQEKRMTPCELIRAHMAPVVKKGPNKAVTTKWIPARSASMRS